MVLRNIFEKNDQAAMENRRLLTEAGVACVNLLGGAGSGKTALLEAVLPRLAPGCRCLVLEGDLATTRDAERIAAVGASVVQLLTDGGCHLNATLVQQALRRVPLGDFDLVVIENVGNPICPANFDLGEHRRISLLSVAEGDDKPAKYPLLFKKADLVIFTKSDLAPHVHFNAAAAVADVRRLDPDKPVISVDALHGDGIDQLLEWLEELVRMRRLEQRMAATGPAHNLV